MRAFGPQRSLQYFTMSSLDVQPFGQLCDIIRTEAKLLPYDEEVCVLCCDGDDKCGSVMV